MNALKHRARKGDRMKSLQWVVLLLLVSTAVFSSRTSTPLPVLLENAGIRSETLDVLIEKSEYRLTLLYKNRKIKSYPVVFGFNPVDDKRIQGDGCTPEGIFHIRTKYPHREWSKFIWIDYPNADSWKKFQASRDKGEIPPRSTIGGDIGIHGVPAGTDPVTRKQNWTLGCISLTRDAIDEIYPYITKRSRIEIRH
jgi:murein L,D-transpeptidase YafK